MTSLEQKMLDHSASMILLVDTDGLQIVQANRQAGQVLGYTVEELLERKIIDIESSLPDVFYWEEVAAGVFTEIEWQEGLYCGADGELIEVSKSISLIQHEEKTYLLVQARDIRQERRTEEQLEQTLSRLRATLEATGNGILAIDWHGRIVSMNRMFSAMWAIPETLLEQHKDDDVIAHVSSRVKEEAACRERLSAIMDSEESDEHFNLADGRVFECKSRPQYLGEHIVGRVFSFADVTRRVAAEDALRESLDKLELRVEERTGELQSANSKLRAEREQQAVLIARLEEAQSQLIQSEKMASIGQLAAGVAHEINNPVGFVKSNLGTLQRYIADLGKVLKAYAEIEHELGEVSLASVSQLKKDLELDYLQQDLDILLAETNDGVQRVQDIVRDLKNFSHVGSSEFVLANLEMGLDSTLNVVWNELKYKAKVVKEYAAIPEIMCAPSQLNQVFMNLLVNASHAIEERGQISIRTTSTEAEVRVEIEDTGRGIPPENLGRIFEPFFTTKPVGKGTGLGLSLSYGIVKKHHGRIEVSSEVGKGSRFTVILPREVDYSAAEAGGKSGGENGRK
ncbi:ATP-binding protein [Dechloromonas sp.]|uniref:ATP-binding protein n=1 Tax=Dechloromonas sp. TaxID=1917218 RepID=UPI00286E5BBD|nr:ATP-binding protein [Dechloromonas sp.]